MSTFNRTDPPLWPYTLDYGAKQVNIFRRSVKLRLVFQFIIYANSVTLLGLSKRTVSGRQVSGTVERAAGGSEASCGSGGTVSVG